MMIQQSPEPIVRHLHRLYYRWTQLTAIMLCLGAGSARATPPPTVLILSVAEDGRQQDGLRTQVGELVQRAGARLAETPGLSAAARACEDPGCLTKLAEDHRAELVLAARIERRSKHERLIDMWLYRAKTGTDRSERELCDVRDIKDCLSSLAGKLIGPQLDGGSRAEPAPPPPSDTKIAAPTGAGATLLVAAAIGKSPPTQAPPEKRPRLPGWRIGLGLGFTALAAGTLAVGIGANLQQGKGSRDQSGKCTPVGAEPGCAYDLTPLFAPSYAAAGLLAVGAVLSLALPAPQLPRKENH